MNITYSPCISVSSGGPALHLGSRRSDWPVRYRLLSEYRSGGQERWEGIKISLMMLMKGRALFSKIKIFANIMQQIRIFRIFRIRTSKRDQKQPTVRATRKFFTLKYGKKSHRTSQSSIYWLNWKTRNLVGKLNKKNSMLTSIVVRGISFTSIQENRTPNSLSLASSTHWNRISSADFCVQVNR